MTEQLIDVKVLRKQKLAQQIASIQLVRSNGDPLPPFTAGSHIDVHLANGLIRQYSLWNNPAGASHYRIAVLKEQASKGGSEAMHKLRANMGLKISAPRNRFELAADATESLLLAGGIGITPILCMAQVLHDQGAKFELHYCTRSISRTAFQTFLQNSDFASQVHFHFDDGPVDQKLDIPDIARSYRQGRHLYVCGPGGFMDAVLEAAATNWPPEALHKEYFELDVDLHLDGDQPFWVQINSTGDKFEVPADQTIVETLAKFGIEVPTSCEQGICGTCVTGVLEGLPDHRDYVLTEEEHAANDQMTVCCSRARSETILLDL